MFARAFFSLAFLTTLAPLASSCGGPTVDLVDDTLQVVHVSPHHGAVDVRLDPDITVGFSEAVDEASLAETLALVSEDSGGGTKAVEVRIFVDDTGRVVTLVPDAVLEPAQLHRLMLSEDLQATSGATLRAAFRSEFMTRR